MPTLTRMPGMSSRALRIDCSISVFFGRSARGASVIVNAA